MSRYSLLAVLLFTALLRGGVLWVMRENLNEDRDAYRQIAENLTTHGIYGLGNGIQTPRPTAYRPPLYPVLLAKIAGEGLEVTPLRVAMLHWLLGVGTVWLTLVVMGLFCRSTEDQKPSGTEWRPAIAALLVACDPILLNWSTYVMTETLAAFLAILALYTLVRFHFDRRPMNAGFVGCAMGLAILCRPTFLPWAAVCGLRLLALEANKWRQLPDTSEDAKNDSFAKYGRRLVNTAVYGLILAVVVFPWAYRNSQQFRQAIITTTHGGYTFYLANNRFFYRYLTNDVTGLPWDPTELEAQFGSPSKNFEGELESEHRAFLKPPNVGLRPQELILSDLDYQNAQRDIAANPVMFAYSCLYRLVQLWSPLPNKLTADESWKRALLRYAIAVWYLGVYAAALAGVWRLREKLLRSPWIWGVLLCLVFTLVHTFYWSNLRMRAPLMPLVAILASVGVFSVVKNLRRESHTERLC